MPKAPKAAAPATTAGKKVAKKEDNGLFEKRTKNFGVGNNVQPKKDMSRFVKWPKNVRLQRQRRILYQRLKVPPTIAQFTRSVDKNTGAVPSTAGGLVRTAQALTAACGTWTDGRACRTPGPIQGGGGAPCIQGSILCSSAL